MKTVQGISFPFRVGTKGGIVMTKADIYDSTHLGESIAQIIATQVYERVMNTIGSQVSYSIFDPNDVASHTLIKYEIVQAVSTHDKRVKVAMNDIDIYVDEYNPERVYTTVSYEVVSTGLRGIVTAEIGGNVT